MCCFLFGDEMLLLGACVLLLLVAHKQLQLLFWGSCCSAGIVFLDGFGAFVTLLCHFAVTGYSKYTKTVVLPNGRRCVGLGGIAARISVWCIYLAVVDVCSLVGYAACLPTNFELMRDN